MIRRKQGEVIRAERRQLEEIAHLYLPEAGAGRGAAREGPAVPAHPDPPAPAHGPFLVIVAAAGDGVPAAVGCLFNLAVLLKISDGPVLLAASPEAFRERFSFRFRPDRERFSPIPGLMGPGMIRGPMDIRMMAGGALHRWKASDPGQPRPGGGLPPGLGARYLLTDDLSVAALMEGLPGMALFVVTPDTPPEAFDFTCSGPLGGFCARTGCAGIVTAGAGGRQGDGQLLERWRGVLSSRLPGGVSTEGVGTWPGATGELPGDRAMDGGLLVLEDPRGAGARCLMEMAARIRKRRSPEKDRTFARVAGNTGAGR